MPRLTYRQHVLGHARYFPYASCDCFQCFVTLLVPFLFSFCVLIHRWLLARVRILGILCLTWGAMEGLRNEWRSRLGSMPFHGLRTWSDRFQPMEQYLAVGRDYWSTHVVTLTLQLAWDQFQLSYNWTDISQRVNRIYISTYVWVGV